MKGTREDGDGKRRSETLRGTKRTHNVNINNITKTTRQRHKKK